MEFAVAGQALWGEFGIQIQEKFHVNLFILAVFEGDWIFSFEKFGQTIVVVEVVDEVLIFFDHGILLCGLMMLDDGKDEVTGCGDVIGLDAGGLGAGLVDEVFEIEVDGGECGVGCGRPFEVDFFFDEVFGDGVFGLGEDGLGDIGFDGIDEIEEGVDDSLGEFGFLVSFDGGVEIGGGEVGVGDGGAIEGGLGGEVGEGLGVIVVDVGDGDQFSSFD